MVQQTIATISLDFSEAMEALYNHYDVLEVLLSAPEETDRELLEEKLMVIKELASPLPVFARLSCKEIQSLHPLLQTLAVAGLERIIFNSSSLKHACSLLYEAEIVNSKKRLGLSFQLFVKAVV